MYKRQDLEYLRVPKNIRDITIKCAKDVQKVAKKYTFKCWVCFLLQISLVLIIISLTIIKNYYKYVGVVLGMLLSFIFSFYLAHSTKKRNDKIKKAIKYINKATFGIVKTTLIYEYDDDHQFLTDVVFEINQKELQEHLPKRLTFINVNANQNSKPVNFPNMTSHPQNNNGNNSNNFSQQNILNPINPTTRGNIETLVNNNIPYNCLLYTSPSPRD